MRLEVVIGHSPVSTNKTMSDRSAHVDTHVTLRAYANFQRVAGIPTAELHCETQALLKTPKSDAIPTGMRHRAHV